MKQRLSFTLMGVLLIVAVLLPFIAVGVCTFAIPAQYDLSFLGALTDKYERLYSIETQNRYRGRKQHRIRT